MAIYRVPLICANCGARNYFIPNPLSPMQRLTHWVGDNGGHYPNICGKCGKNIYLNESLLQGLKLPPGTLNFNKNKDGEQQS